MSIQEIILRFPKIQEIPWWKKYKGKDLDDLADILSILLQDQGESFFQECLQKKYCFEIFGSNLLQLSTVLSQEEALYVVDFHLWAKKVIETLVAYSIVAEVKFQTKQCTVLSENIECIGVMYKIPLIPYWNEYH